MDYSDGVFSNMCLSVLEKEEMFRVIGDCSYTIWKDGALVWGHVVEEGFVTDLASIPRALRWLFKKTGKSRKPAVFHDHLIEDKWGTRREADKVFRGMLIAVGMPKWKAQIYYWGVSIGTAYVGDYAEC